jgi:hypothetical protein
MEHPSTALLLLKTFAATILNVPTFIVWEKLRIPLQSKRYKLAMSPADEMFWHDNNRLWRKRWRLVKQQVPDVEWEGVVLRELERVV